MILRNGVKNTTKNKDRICGGENIQIHQQFSKLGDKLPSEHKLKIEDAKAKLSSDTVEEAEYTVVEEDEKK